MRQIAAIVWLGAAIALIPRAGLAQASQPCDEERAERDAYSIARVTKTTLPEWLSIDGIPSVGDPFTHEGLERARHSTESRLSADAERIVAPRFRLISASVTCRSMDAAARTVVIDVRADRILVPEGTTAGDVIDEANPFRFEALQQSENVGLRADYDPQLGGAGGFFFRTDVSEVDSTGPSTGRANLGLWISNRSYYRGGFGLAGSFWSDDPRSLRTGAQLNVSFEKLPFGDGEVTSKGFTLGYAAEVQSGRSDVRAGAAFRLARMALNGPVSVDASWDWGLEGSLQQEYTVPGGFMRIGGWFDHAKANPDVRYSRGGLFTRLYENIALGPTSWLLDATVSGGASTRAPGFRAFVGGNRFDPFLAERVQPESEFIWAGPIMRGYGIAGFTLPSAASPVVPGSRYSSVSLTIGLPGFAQPLLERADTDGERERLQTALESEFESTIEGMMTRRVSAGVPMERALRSSRNEGLKLQRVLQNFISHGRRLAVRPLLVVDAGRLVNGIESRNGVTVGGGLRLASLKYGFEMLVTDVVHDTMPALSAGRQFLLRAHLRTDFVAN